MNFWLTLSIGFVLGGFVGLLIAAILGAAAHGDYYADLDEVWQARDSG